MLCSCMNAGNIAEYPCHCIECTYQIPCDKTQMGQKFYVQTNSIHSSNALLACFCMK